MNPYFVDKSMALKELFQMIDAGNEHICITRPRRFGKTVMTNMIASFFSSSIDSSDIFDNLKIAKDPDYKKHLNQYKVIQINFSEMPDECESYRAYIRRVHKLLKEDLQELYPQLNLDFEDATKDLLRKIHERTGDEFIFVFDEWDYIFHEWFMTERDKNEYLTFLSALLKDQSYVKMTYMTGILPIAKYSSGSKLNMFVEYTMVEEEKFSDTFGFTDEEVDELFKRYQERTENQHLTREDLRIWYDGYYIKNGKRIYNPRSVVVALTNNNLGNYWTNSGPYDEIFSYIEHNVDDVRDDVALMVSGESVPAKVREYAAVSMNLTARDYYRVEREDKSGTGFVDFIFYPNNQSEYPGMILELKVDATPEEAIQQIKEKQYDLKLRGRLGEDKENKILAVGISYDKKSKNHKCRVETL